VAKITVVAPVVKVHYRRVIISILLLLAPTGLLMAYEEDSIQQKMVKSVFIFNIAKFVSWPEEVYQKRSQKFILCHFLEDSLGVGFEIIRNRSVSGRNLSKRVSLTLGEAKICDILFVGNGRLEDFLAESPKSDLAEVLVVADRTKALNKGQAFVGVHISLVREESNIGFEINLSEISKSKIELSPKLLELSTIVGENQSY